MKSLFVLLVGLMMVSFSAYSEDSSINSPEQNLNILTEAAVAGPKCKECESRLHPDSAPLISRDKSKRIVRSAVDGTGDVVPLDKQDSEDAPGTK